MLLASAPAFAHDSRPVYIEITEISSNVFSVGWKVPPTVQQTNIPRIQPGDHCTANVPDTVAVLRGKEVYRCSSVTSGPGIISLSYPKNNPALSTVVKITYEGQQPIVLHAAPERLSIELPPPESPASAFSGYGMLGISHIFTGYDHLLFVALLVVLAGNLKKIFYAVTGFTLAHSITLVLSSVQWITLPIAPVEAVIALSIAWLAAELARDRKDSVTHRHPQWVAALFGLLHGLGFAAVLRDIGLPSSEILVALVSFNLGVEAGQLMFVAILVMMLKVLAAWRPGFQLAGQPGVTVLLVYPAGILAMFWVFDRLRFIIPPS